MERETEDAKAKDRHPSLPFPEPGRRLWLDEDDADAVLADLPDHFRRPLTDLRHHGVTILRGAVAPEVCDHVVTDLDLWLRSNSDWLARVADEKGRFRLNNLHLWSEAALSLCLDERVLEVLDAAFDYPAVPYSSLTFVKGTEQEIHRDGPYFSTWPNGYFFGVWTALEDIDPHSGPLHYYGGGHRVDADRRATVYDYGRSVDDACRRDGLDLTRLPELQKGDVVIWHPDLPHGGSEIIDPALTRKSIVVHYKAGTIPLHGPEAFFGRRDGTIDADTYVEHRGRWLVDHGGPSL